MNAVTEKAGALQLAPEATDYPMVAPSSSALILDSASMDSILRMADVIHL